MKNKLIIFFVRILSLLCRKNSDSSRILVISTTALGDSLWATPTLDALRKSFPHATIDFLTSPIGEMALRHNPWINKTWILKEPMLRHFLSLWKNLYKRRFSTVLILHASQRLILPLASLLGANIIVSTKGINKGLDQLLTHPVEAYPEHEIQRRLRLLETIGGKKNFEGLSFFLQKDELHPPLPKGSWIALHPGSKDSFKRWPLSHFIEVGIALSNLGHHILITGTQEEKAICQELKAHIPNAICSDPTLSLRKFAGLLKRIDLLISNDTGPVHLASALNVPVIALYSPTNPFFCGPHQALHATAISRPPTCSPCLKRACEKPFCLLQIGSKEVIEKAIDCLSKKNLKHLLQSG